MLRLILAALLLPATSLAQTFLPTDSYAREKVGGFELYVNPVVSTHGKAGADALGLLRKKVGEAAKVLPGPALERLRTVRLFVEWKSPTSDCLTYHSSATALGAAQANLDKWKGIEVGSLECFAKEAADPQPMLLVRALSLAYLDQVAGWESPEVTAMWQRARTGGLYATVPYVSGGMRSSMALGSTQEFFAETSEALFGANDYFPFNVEDLARFDRPACDTVERTWGATGLCNGDAKKPPKAPAKKKSTSKSKKSGKRGR